MTYWTASLTHNDTGETDTVSLDLPDWFSDDEVLAALTDEITRVYGTDLEITRVANDEV